MRRLFKGLFVWAIFFVFSLVAGASASPPSRSQVAEYLKTLIRPEFHLDSFKFKNFQGADEGSGRTSVSGTIVLTKELIQSNGNKTLLRALADYGISNKQTYFLVNYKFGKAFVKNIATYIVTNNSGERYSFELDLSYLETVSGSRLSGGRSVSHLQRQVMNNKKINENLIPPQFIQDSLEYVEFINTIKIVKTSTIKKRNQAYNSVVELFTGEKFMVKGDDGIQYYIDCPSNLKPGWNVKEEFKNLVVATVCNARFLKKTRIGYAMFKPGQRDEVRFFSEVKYLHRFEVIIKIEAKEPGTSKWRSYGDKFQWNGDEFMGVGMNRKWSISPMTPERVEAERLRQERVALERAATERRKKKAKAREASEQFEAWKRSASNGMIKTRIELGEISESRKLKKDRSMRVRVQRMLMKLGFEPGNFHGDFDQKTRTAIRDWSKSRDVNRFCASGPNGWRHCEYGMYLDKRTVKILLGG